MKYFLIIVVLLAFHLNISAQSGVYIKEPINIDGTKVKWTLTLDEDGTFLYHFLRDISAVSKPNIEENYYGKGTWTLEGKSVILFSNETDNLNGQYTVNLNNSKARYITKSPRNTSDKVIKTALLFYESDHIKGLELFKIE
ncbi:MAG TPA: hypothetical protein VGA80_04170 [Flavobacteriaceae bacterium]